MSLTTKLFFALAVVAHCSLASATTISISPTKDTTIFSENNNAAGSNEVLHIGVNTMNRTRRSLMQFDIAGQVPSGATITGVTLNVHLNASDVNTTRTLELHKVTSAWGDVMVGTGGATGMSGMGFAAVAGTTTWTNRIHSGTPWTTAGGDFNPASSGTFLFVPPLAAINPLMSEPAYSFSSAGMAADAQNWLNNPAVNFGWMLINPDPTPSTLYRFSSNERSVLAYRPTLTVDFFVPAPAPEPSSVLLIGCMIPAMLMSARRRRLSQPVAA